MTTDVLSEGNNALMEELVEELVEEMAKVMP